jgi:NADH:ubiquinone oxidoreductase subunit 5 (subunit L)/multisubunit Na+/H+ antiporter MnhA subunit
MIDSLTAVIGAIIICISSMAIAYTIGYAHETIKGRQELDSLLFSLTNRDN